MMTETNDDVTPPDPAIVASIAAEMRGKPLPLDPDADVKRLERIAAAEAEQAAFRERETARRRAAEAADRAELERQQQEAARAERQRELHERTRKHANSATPFERLAAIEQHAREQTAFRHAVLNDVRRNNLLARHDEIVRDLKNLLDPDPPPTVVVQHEEIDPDGSPYLGSPDFNPNHPRRLFLRR